MRLTGVSDVKVVPEPLAAAVGSGLDVSSPYAQALIDIGDGVTDIAIIRSGVLIKKAAVRLACGNFHLAVRRTVANRYGVLIPLREAERLTREIGAVCRSAKLKATSPALGLDRLTRRETAVSVNREDVCNAIRPVIRIILETVREMFRCLPPDTAAEVIESGICLTGGGAFLKGVKELIAEETSLEVRVAADPLHGVISGAGQMLSVGVSTGFWRF
jgi:rod shape-determining protein MreB